MNRGVIMDWNNNGRLDAGDYANYKMAIESSSKNSSNNASHNNTTSDGGLKFLLLVIVVSVVYAVLEAIGSN